MSDAELHTLTGAYALHALADAESDAFERHLGDCEACTVEVRELSETATRLGLATAAVPPPGLRERVLREITAVRQESPSKARPSRAAGAAGRAARWPRFALAACLVAAAGLGGIAVWQNQEARTAHQDARAEQRRNERLVQVLAAPDARSASRALGGGAKGTVVVSEKEDRAVFLVSGMRKPPIGKVYQLWFDDDGTMRSAGLMKAAGTSTPQYATLLDGRVDGASGIGITVEPAGGSARPTSAPLALLALPTA
ncbi:MULTISPECIES: anti-sigma factor domain-containing protein [unclassified Streptomyces]|uniref:anti-sigma factor n=1 Tax=unclassified Streptomyces TaxID=2593676 RepID=UPI0036EE6768